MGLFNLGGTLCKSVFALYLLRLSYGPLAPIEASLSEKELRFRDPVSLAEYLMHGEALGIDPIVFKVDSFELFKPPERFPFVIIDDRVIRFPEAEIDPSGKLFYLIRPRREVHRLKGADVAYYLRRYGVGGENVAYIEDPEGKNKVAMRFFTAKFASKPRKGMRVHLKKNYEERIFVALDMRRDILALMINEGSRARIVETVKLYVELPSILLYVEALYKSRKAFIETLLEQARLVSR